MCASVERRKRMQVFVIFERNPPGLPGSKYRQPDGRFVHHPTESTTPGAPSRPSLEADVECATKADVHIEANARAGIRIERIGRRFRGVRKV